MKGQSQLSREFAIIPYVARVLAVIGFALVQICLLVLLPHYSHQVKDLPPRPVMTLIAIVGGLFFALFILLVGYVNADTKRRGMSSLLWTLLVIFIPKAIGFLAYFLLRKPLLVAGTPNCPKCGTGIGPDFRFCPKCGYSFVPACVHCGRGIQNDFMVCPYCGKAVSAPVMQGPVAQT
ncbi:MAG TPA: zinc ribbon domain-containing protein [Terriglobales bacterium]|jgi:RNA polymerase subunit RPABC4/transcription elongation factor Spt4|nr:zinc ribbon domain-containing protein [Terriglobales bacterium]